MSSELPGPEAFAAASQFVRPDDVADAIPCGSNVDDFVAAVRPYVDAGFTHLALVQVGADSQAGFLEWAARELLPALRALEHPATTNETRHLMSTMAAYRG